MGKQYSMAKLKVTAEDRSLLEDAARAAGVPLRRFIRNAAQREAKAMFGKASAMVPIELKSESECSSLPPSGCADLLSRTRAGIAFCLLVQVMDRLGREPYHIGPDEERLMLRKATRRVTGLKPEFC